MKMRDVMSLIAFGVAVAFAVGYISTLGVRVRPPSDRINVSMTVADINGLAIDSNVLLRGVPVGKVTNIQSSLTAATVDFYIDGRFRVPIDSEVRLENLSALGESYIGLFPRSQKGGMLHDGQRIATESVRQPASISELATSVVRVLNQLDPGQIERIIGEADAAFPAPNAVLPNLTHAARVLRNTAADMHGHGRALLDNFQSLLANAGFVGPILTDLTPLVFSIGRDLRSSFASFLLLLHYGGPRNIDNLTKFLTRIQRLLDTNGGDLRVLGEALQPKLKAIAGALLNFDAGQILTNVLDSVPEDGRVTFHVSAPSG
jgi:phospholipid/cholesterol/gamma-HCH transport system substrate-binding protein